MPDLKRLTLISLVLVLLLSGCGKSPSAAQKRTPLRVIIAGSLLAPFQAIEEEYERLHPEIDLQLEGHGSVQVIRSVTELGRPADLVVVADAQLIPLMMHALNIPGEETAFTDWCIEFATNKLGIAYRDGALYSDQIDRQNWHEIISKPDVSLGLADPRIDAMGYRTLMVMQLAQSHHSEEALFERSAGSLFEPPITVKQNDGIATISVPEVLRPTEARTKLRSYSIQLLALLESGDLDYSFEYESVACQRDLNFLRLPPEIDLSEPEHEELYQKVRVNLDFQRFRSLIPDFTGTQIVYGMSIPNNAPNPDGAVELVEFLLGPGGAAIFDEYHQPILTKPFCDNPEQLPPELARLFSQE